MNNNIDLVCSDESTDPTTKSWSVRNRTTGEVLSRKAPAIEYAWIWAAQALARKLDAVREAIGG